MTTKTCKHSEYIAAVPWPRGTLVGLAPQTKLQASQIEIWNTINKLSFCIQASLHKRKLPYWRLSGDGSVLLYIQTTMCM